jgi:outer membrane protein assembly factor BamB
VWPLLFLAVWPVFGHDAARTGASGDRAITTANVKHLRERWSTRLGEVADSSPIYVDGVRGRAMLLETARDGTTYGIDARTGRVLWRFHTQGPNITTSVPAADPSHGRVYVTGVDGEVHQLSIESGAEKRSGGFPVRITRMPQTEKLAASLNLANGYLYAVTSGYIGDAPPYVGHVVAVHLGDGVTHVFNTLCSNSAQLPAQTSCPQSGSGMWSRAGVVVDSEPSMRGRIYVATGNGVFDAQSGGHNYGDSVVALSADARAVIGYYTPPNYAQLEQGDADLGSSAPVLLPREAHSKTPLMLVQGGKDGILRLLNRQRLPGLGGELARTDLGAALFSAAAVWRDAQQRTWIYIGLDDGLRAFRVTTDASGNTRLEPAWRAHVGQTREGTSPVVENGVVFVAMDNDIVALDAQTGAKLWGGASAGQPIGAVHWESPIVVEGWLYCSDESGKLTAYAL